ncbi:MAG: hypothetical protein J7459_12555, partial [Chloroflexus sp.]|nr:hypothetical protein [Chloroflexus sp.]
LSPTVRTTTSLFSLSQSVYPTSHIFATHPTAGTLLFSEAVAEYTIAVQDGQLMRGRDDW